MLPRFLGRRLPRHLRYLARSHRQPPVSSLHSLSSQLPAVGTNIHGFRVDQLERVPELNATAVTLSHVTSGAQYLHVARDDVNNVFSIGFKTTPMDSSGVAHILEHTTLCGSHKFPARDPFFKMLNRSLATFMNAFTASDWTMYPFSTCNEADYMNLLSIYMDAVFQPRLNRLDFLQEGWRLEHADVNDKDSPIMFKGVVYNEMKGALSDQHRVFAEKLQNTLLPSHTYRHCSGGDPLHIPDLTHEQLCHFHATHYHPKNCRIFSYGNLPLEPRLKFINDEYLSQAPNEVASDTSVPPENRWDKQRSVNIKCRHDPLAPDPEKQCSVAVGFLLDDVTNMYESLLDLVLSELLVGGPAAPFYQSLIESGLGSDFTPYVTGFDNSCRESAFTVGLQGIAESDAQKVVEIIDRTLKETVEKGFEKERIDAILHRIELSRKHQSQNFGLSLLMQAVAPWYHGGNPVDTLRIDDILQKFRRELEANPRLLQNRLAERILDNRHRVVAVMTPDTGYEADEQKKEQKILEAKVAALTAEQKENVYRDGQQLLQKQAQGDDASSLPILRVENIADKSERYEFLHDTVSRVPVQLCEQPTNGIIYFRAVINTSHVPAYFRPLLPLFCSLMSKMGTANVDFRQQDQREQLWTGGLSANVTVTDSPTTVGRFEEGVVLRSYCLEHNTDNMFSLWRDIFSAVSFENRDRLQQLLQMSAAELANSVSQAGHQYAMGVAQSGLSASSQLRQQYSGLDQVRYVKSLVNSGDIDMLVTKMKMLGNMVLTKDGMRVALNGSAVGLKTGMVALNQLLSETPGEGKEDIQVQPSFTPDALQTYVELPLPVHYASRSVPTVPYTHADFAPLRVLARLISLGHLHREIREKGGAYGGGAIASPSGVWSYYSYRDPNSFATLDVFDSVADFVRDHRFSAEDIEGAKLGVFQSVDAPVVPSDRGMRRFLSRITDAEFDEHRMRLKRVTLDDVRRVSEEYLRRPRLCGTCILGKKCDSLDKDWKVVQS